MQLKQKNLLENNKAFYIAYGSNLDIETLKSRCPSVCIKGMSQLNNYKLVYRGIDDYLSYLTLEECEGSVVPIVLYEMNYLDINSLDQFEGYPILYTKNNLEIIVNEEKYNAFIYVMNDNYDYHMPSYHYIRICERGYNFYSFDNDVLNHALIDTKQKIKKRFLTK